MESAAPTTVADKRRTKPTTLNHISNVLEILRVYVWREHKRHSDQVERLKHKIKVSGECTAVGLADELKESVDNLRLTTTDLRDIDDCIALINRTIRS